VYVAPYLILAVASLIVGLLGLSDNVIKVRNGYLDGYPHMTVGEAFGAYMENARWEEVYSNEDGDDWYDWDVYVNVSGSILYMEKEVAAVVQFKVRGQTFEYNACEFNGIPQPDTVFLELLEKVYGASNMQVQGSVMTTNPATQAATTAAPTTNSAKLTMKDAYDAIILDYGFTPGNAGEFPEDYYIIDIIGDFAPELVIGGDTTRNGRLTGAIYGYDATVGEAFQYRGVTEIHNAEKGKGEYCIDWNWSYLGDYYTVYTASEQYINEVKSFTVDHENGQYFIDDEVVSQTDFLADISKYLDPDEYDTELIYDEPEPSYGGTEVIMTTDELTNLNIFISNFLEAYFTEYDPMNTGDSELIHFAYMHNRINYRERMNYVDYHEGLEASYITSAVKRFFNRDVSLYSFDSYIYQDGRLYSPAADGDPFSNFAQVYRVERDSSGAYIAYFDECQPVEIHDAPSTEMYAPYYTWRSAVYDAVVTTGRGGYAVVRSVTLNGRATYQLEYLYTETW